MRLYLSSYKFGNHPEELSRLVGQKNHTGIILNASDFDSEAEHTLHLNKQIKRFEILGFTSEEIDLRKYFGKPEDLKDFLTKFNLIWVRGGNVFLLQRAFEQSGFNIIIKKMLKNDLLVYAGESAGSVIAGPSLQGLDIVDNSTDIPYGYTNQFSMEGLNLVDYMIAPHYKSDHPESIHIDKLVDYFKKNKIFYKTLKDGEAIIIENSKEKVLS